MFTLIKFRLKTYDGSEYIRYPIHMTFEAHLAMFRMNRDARYSDIEVIGVYDSLSEARAVQSRLDGAA